MFSDVVASVLMKVPVLYCMTPCLLVHAPLVRQHFLLLSSGGYPENEGCLSGRSSSNLLHVNGHGVMCRKTEFCSCTGQSPEDRHNNAFDTSCPQTEHEVLKECQLNWLQNF